MRGWRRLPRPTPRGPRARWRAWKAWQALERNPPRLIEMTAILKEMWSVDDESNESLAKRRAAWLVKMRAWNRLAPHPGRDRHGRKRAPRPPPPEEPVRRKGMGRMAKAMYSRFPYIPKGERL